MVGACSRHRTRRTMTDLTLFVGLDVHKKTISVALVDAVAKADVRHDCEHAGYAAQPVQEAVEGWTAFATKPAPAATCSVS